MALLTKLLATYTVNKQKDVFSNSLDLANYVIGISGDFPSRHATAVFRSTLSYSIIISPARTLENNK